VGILFVIALVAATIAAFFTWAFASHCALTVIEETAAGNREVTLENDPLPDWIWKGWYLAWMIAVWVAPSMFLAFILTPFFEERWRGPAYVIIAASAFWLAFPISLLSSLAAESRWTVLHSGVFARLVRQPGAWLTFLVLTALIVIPCAAAVGWQLLSNHFASVIVAPIVLGAGMLLYARFAGRFAEVLQYTKLPFRRKAKTKRRIKRQRNVEVTDPWEVPEESHETFVQPSAMSGLQVPFEGEVVGYDVNFEEPPQVVQSTAERTWSEETADVPDVKDDRDAEDHRKARLAALNIKPDAVELEHLKQRQKKQPPMTWMESLLTMPRSGGVIKMYAFMTLGFVVVSVLVRAVRDLWPF
jgi:hypothetical protein